METPKNQQEEANEYERRMVETLQVPSPLGIFQTERGSPPSTRTPVPAACALQSRDKSTSGPAPGPSPLKDGSVL